MMSNKKDHIEQFFKKHLEVEQDVFMDEDWALMEEKLDMFLPVKAGGFWSKGTFITITIATLAFVAGWLIRPLFTPDDNHSNESFNINFPIERDLLPIALLAANNQSEKLSHNKINNKIIEKSSPNDINTNPVGTEYVDVGRSEKQANTNGSANLIPYHITLNKLSPAKDQGIIKPVSLNQIKPRKPLSKGLFDRTDSISDFEQFRFLPFGYGISISPDFNGIFPGQFIEPTFKSGINLYWFVHPKFIVETGVFYNKKRYVSPGEEYHPPQGYWIRRTNGIIPDDIEGSCGVIDIPVKIRYQIAAFGKYQIEAMAGISNYIMLDQEYYYKFENDNPGTAYSWETYENETIKWSVMNFGLSTGYSNRNGTSILLEPYLQVPLDGVGWAKVKLYSAGINITYRKQLIYRNKL